MNRVIKFRGKSVQNNEWYYGDLTINCTVYTWIRDKLLDDYEVINDTVGQYTGLTDKNAVEIYEGDVVTSSDYPFQYDDKYNYHGLIEWSTEYTSYYLVLKSVNKRIRGISNNIGKPLQDYITTKLEVIGNIHDNPGLLEMEE